MRQSVGVADSRWRYRNAQRHFRDARLQATGRVPKRICVFDAAGGERWIDETDLPLRANGLGSKVRLRYARSKRRLIRVSPTCELVVDANGRRKRCCSGA